MRDDRGELARTETPMSSLVTRPGLEEMRRELSGAIETALRDETGLEPGALGIEYLCDPKEVADDPAKLLVQDATGRKRAVVLVSSPVDPELVGRGMRIAAEARARLEPGLREAILEPLGEGRLGPCSYTILPYRRPLPDGPLARRLWRRAIRAGVLDWVAGVARTTRRDVPEARIGEAIEAPLEHLSRLETMPVDVREAAGRSLEAFRGGGWKAVSVLMHGDLWEDNLLLAANASWFGPTSAFVVIDWPGATLDGYPFYDLLRISRSMRVGAPGIRREVQRHCDSLGLGADGAMGHLLACLGQIGLHLGHFPMDMYVDMSRACVADLRVALGREES